MTAGSTTTYYESEKPPETTVATSTEVAEDNQIEGVKSTESHENSKNDIPSGSKNLEALESKFGSNHPLIAVASCESQFRQYAADGTVLRGHINPQDVGIFQVNEGYHLQASEEMGLDIHTLEGNMEYAEHLYDNQGLQPWNWSRHCWGGKV